MKFGIIVLIFLGLCLVVSIMLAPKILKKLVERNKDKLRRKLGYIADSAIIETAYKSILEGQTPEEQNDGRISHYIGSLLTQMEYSNLVEHDVKKGLLFYYRALKLGYASYNMIARVYWNYHEGGAIYLTYENDEEIIDLEKARNILAIGAQKGCPFCQHDLAFFYYKETEFADKDKYIAYWFGEAAKQGFLQSKIILRTQGYMSTIEQIRSAKWKPEPVPETLIDDYLQELMMAQ